MGLEMMGFRGRLVFCTLLVTKNTGATVSDEEDKGTTKVVRRSSSSDLWLKERRVRGYGEGSGKMIKNWAID